MIEIEDFNKKCNDVYCSLRQANVDRDSANISQKFTLQSFHQLISFRSDEFLESSLLKNPRDRRGFQENEEDVPDMNMLLKSD